MNGVWWDALCDGERSHDMRFYELIVCRTASEDEVGSDAGFVLANTFEGAFTLLWGRCSIRVGWSAEDDDGVVVREVRVAGGDGSVGDNSANDCEDDECEGDDQELAKKLRHNVCALHQAGG